MPAADLCKRTAERTAGRREAVEVRETGMKGAEPVGAEPPPAAHVPVEGAPPPVPQPPEGEDEVLPDRELNLDGIGPPPLLKLYKRLPRRLKLHLKHYHMSSAQFRSRTSELYLPEGVYAIGVYDNVVKGFEICQKTKPAPPRSRFSGVRAKDFGDVMDHLRAIKHMTKKRQLFLVLDGATSLLWGATQEEGTEPAVTQD